MMLTIIRISFLFCLFQIILSTSLQDYNGCHGIAYSNLCVKLGSKYYLIDAKSQLNWFEAERFCRRQGGFLATIETADESRLISDYLISQNYESDGHWFWISGNDLGAEGNFYSISTGKLLPFTDWAKGQPDNAGGKENCAELGKKANGYELNDVNCERKIHFICELGSEKLLFDVRHDWSNGELLINSINQPIITTLSLTEDSFCAGRAHTTLCVRLGGKTYLIGSTTKMNYFEAERFCRRQKGFLAHIENETELNTLSDYLVKQNYLNRNYDFWIDGNDLGSEGTFYSSLTYDIMPYTKWSTGQPDNYRGKENCVHLWEHNNTFVMNDGVCEFKINFICEIES